MESRMLEKNMIFYTPGKKGVVFTLAAKHYITPELLNQTIEHLEYETENPIKYVEERRTKSRPSA